MKEREVVGLWAGPGWSGPRSGSAGRGSAQRRFLAGQARAAGAERRLEGDQTQAASPEPVRTPGPRGANEQRQRTEASGARSGPLTERFQTLAANRDQPHWHCLDE